MTTTATRFDRHTTVCGIYLRLIVWRWIGWNLRALIPWVQMNAYEGPFHILGIGPVWVEWGKS